MSLTLFQLICRMVEHSPKADQDRETIMTGFEMLLGGHRQTALKYIAVDTPTLLSKIVYTWRVPSVTGREDVVLLIISNDEEMHVEGLEIYDRQTNLLRGVKGRDHMAEHYEFIVRTIRGEPHDAKPELTWAAVDDALQKILKR